MMTALETQAPAMREIAGRSVLLHADFKPSNLHWTNDDRLLVLDWEFAYSGSALSDVGQLLRWRPPAEFERAFARSYVEAGGALPTDYTRWAALFDLVNLAGLLANLAGTAPSRRAQDVAERVEETLALFT
jgi:aminoglycoside phosphotransferase (APT) family kinase protein